MRENCTHGSEGGESLEKKLFSTPIDVRDGNLELSKPILSYMKLLLIWFSHPCALDSGNPCRNDGYIIVSIQSPSLCFPPLKKGESIARGIYLIKSSLTPLFQRGGLNKYI